MGKRPLKPPSLSHKKHPLPVPNFLSVNTCITGFIVTLINKLCLQHSLTLTELQLQNTILPVKKMSLKFRAREDLFTVINIWTHHQQLVQQPEQKIEVKVVFLSLSSHKVVWKKVLSVKGSVCPRHSILNNLVTIYLLCDGRSTLFCCNDLHFEAK